MLLLTVIHIFFGFWVYKKTGGIRSYALLAAAMAAYCLAGWDYYHLSFLSSRFSMAQITSLFACILVYLMFLSGSRLFQWMSRPGTRILTALVLAGVYAAQTTFRDNVTKAVTDIVLIGFLCAAVAIVVYDWLQHQNAKNRAVHTAMALYQLSPFWVVLSSFFSFLPLEGLEITGVVYTIYLGVQLLSGQFHSSEMEQPFDVSPSMRIAYSGVQLLNHSFKNKLLTMEMALGTIRSKEEGNDQINGELVLIEQSVEHLKQMVQRLRERTKTIVLQEKTINLETLIHTIVDELKPFIPSSLDLQLNGNLNAIILCDPVHLKEVIHNIIRNSVEAIGKKEGRIRIYLHPPIPHNWLTLCIEDNGPGIPLNSLNRVFEPYFTTKAGTSNYGLGLSYCYNVMRASSCSIKMNSSPGDGTTVILSFPPRKVLVYPEFK